MTIRALVTELTKRWPAVVGILRGKTVVYAAEINRGTLYLRNPRGGVVIDSLFTNCDNGVHVVRNHVSTDGDNGLRLSP